MKGTPEALARGVVPGDFCCFHCSNAIKNWSPEALSSALSRLDNVSGNVRVCLWIRSRGDASKDRQQ